VNFYTFSQEIIEGLSIDDRRGYLRNFNRAISFLQFTSTYKRTLDGYCKGTSHQLKDWQELYSNR